MPPLSQIDAVEGVAQWSESRGKSRQLAIFESKPGMSNPRPTTLSHAALFLDFYILTFKNSTYIFRRFFNSISINECFISLIFLLDLFC